MSRHYYQSEKQQVGENRSAARSVQPRRLRVAGLVLGTLLMGTCITLIFATLSCGLPELQLSQDTDQPTTPSSHNAKTALQALAQLPVRGPAPREGYSREQFGQRWADVDRNGCDTRNDILNRDLTQVVHRRGTHGCTVHSGTLLDPYTGKTISFLRGEHTSPLVQIDHVVALANAWRTGAQQLSVEQRQEFANDPLNLLAVDGPTNKEKGSADASAWLPPNHEYRCEYGARQIAVKIKYGLWVTPSEKAALEETLGKCPNQPLP